MSGICLSRRIEIYLFTALVVATLFSGCLVRSFPDPLRQKKEREIDELIARNERLKTLATLCSELGTLQEFTLMWRAISKDGSDLYFYYRSTKPFVSASVTFAKYLDARGWRRLDESQPAQAEFFRKDDLIIDIQYGGIGDAQYGITCAHAK